MGARLYIFPTYWIERSPAGRVGGACHEDQLRGIHSIYGGVREPFGSLWGAIEGGIEGLVPSTTLTRLGCHLHLYCLFAGMSRCVREAPGWLYPLSPASIYSLHEARNLPPWWTLKFHQLDGPIWTYWLFPFPPCIVYFSIFSGKLEEGKWKRVLPLHYPRKRHWLSSKWESALKSIANDFFSSKEINLVWFFLPNVIREIRFFWESRAFFTVYTNNQWV